MNEVVLTFHHTNHSVILLKYNLMIFVVSTHDYLLLGDYSVIYDYQVIDRDEHNRIDLAISFT